MNDEKEPRREILISREEIQERIKVLAREIAPIYQGKRLMLVCVLKGAFMFASDLSRALYDEGLTDIQIEFIQISSYGGETESSGEIRLLKDLDEPVTNRNVLLVEDIVDTGRSLEALRELMITRGVASLAAVCLLSKSSRREVDVQVEYTGFEVYKWVDGFGLDTNQINRASPDIHQVLQ